MPSLIDDVGESATGRRGPSYGGASRKSCGASTALSDRRLFVTLLQCVTVNSEQVLFDIIQNDVIAKVISNCYTNFTMICRYQRTSFV